jgi:hypothetical protein
LNKVGSKVSDHQIYISNPISFSLYPMTKNLFDLSQRRILVTGSNGGIGHSFAIRLAQHGATVILNGQILYIDGGMISVL